MSHQNWNLFHTNDPSRVARQVIKQCVLIVNSGWSTSSSLIFLYKKKRVIFFSKDKYFKFSGENTCSQVSLFKLGVCCSPLLSYSQQNPLWEGGGGWSAGDQIQHSFFSGGKKTRFSGRFFLNLKTNLSQKKKSFEVKRIRLN